MSEEEIAGYVSRKAMFEDLYYTEGLSLTQISVRVGVSKTQLVHWMDELGMERRGRGGDQASGKHMWFIHHMDPRMALTVSFNQVVMFLPCSYSLFYKYKRGVCQT